MSDRPAEASFATSHEALNKDYGPVKMSLDHDDHVFIEQSAGVSRGGTDTIAIHGSTQIDEMISWLLKARDYYVRVEVAERDRKWKTTAVIGGAYKHLKTGGMYTVLDIVTDEETKRDRVVYRALGSTDTVKWDRRREVFEDGRFKRIS